MAILKVDKLRAGYGPIDVLHDIDITVEQGEIVAMIGANGAGKTTTLMAISGVVPARSGSIIFQDDDITNVDAHTIVASGLTQSPEGRKIFPRLSVRENLRMGAFTRDDGPDAIDADVESMFKMFPILKERQNQAGGLLSGGQQQMLAMARALMAKPKLLLLDEPSLGLAPQIVVQIFDVIKDLNQKGMSVLLVEQNARMALKIAKRGYVLETGNVAFTGSSDELMNDPRIRAAYLGE